MLVECRKWCKPTLTLRNFKKVRELQKKSYKLLSTGFFKACGDESCYKIKSGMELNSYAVGKGKQKYIYGQVREGARAKDFELAIQWLLDCGLIHKVQR